MEVVRRCLVLTELEAMGRHWPRERETWILGHFMTLPTPIAISSQELDQLINLFTDSGVEIPKRFRLLPEMLIPKPKCLH